MKKDQSCPRPSLGDVYDYDDVVHLILFVKKPDVNNSWRCTVLANGRIDDDWVFDDEVWL
jgi:hypothetical protein